MEHEAKKCTGIEVQPKPKILPEIKVMIEEDKQFWNYKDDIIPDADGELPQWKYSSLQMHKLFDWLPWGKPGCFCPIQASSVELMESITDEIQNLGGAQVEVIQDDGTIQSTIRIQPINEKLPQTFAMIGELPVLYHTAQGLYEQEIPIQVAESERYETLALGESKVQVLESSASVSISSQVGNKTLDHIINAAVDEETLDGFSFLTSMAYSPCRHSGCGYYRNPHGIRGGNYSYQGRGRGPNSYHPAIYEEDYYEIEERLAHCRQENCSMHIPPMETSFSHWNMLLLSQDKNPIIGRIFAGNPNIWFFRCLPNRDVISSLNPPNSHDPNGGTYIQIGGLLKEKRLFSGRLPN